jgi:hypothetical protein
MKSLHFLSAIVSLGLLAACGDNREIFQEKSPNVGSRVVRSPVAQPWVASEDVNPYPTYPQSVPAPVPVYPTPVPAPGRAPLSNEEFAVLLVQVQKLDCVQAAQEQRDSNDLYLESVPYIPTSTSASPPPVATSWPAPYPPTTTKGIIALVRKGSSLVKCTEAVRSLRPEAFITVSDEGVILMDLSFVADVPPYPLPDYSYIEPLVNLLRREPCIESASASGEFSALVFVVPGFLVENCMTIVSKSFPDAKMIIQKENVFTVAFPPMARPVGVPGQ